jgi:hypothetical protein
MLRAHMNEMNVQAIDLGYEVRQGLQLRLAPAPVVFCPPIVREFLHRRGRHALRGIRDRLLFRPPCRFDAIAQFRQFRFRNVYMTEKEFGTVEEAMQAGVEFAIKWIDDGKQDFLTER